MFKNLCELLNTHVVSGKITTNGNCFLHALEYALGNCGLLANRQDLYQKTRRDIAAFAIQKLRRQEKDLLKEYKKFPRSASDLERFKQTFDDRISFLEEFKTNDEYSNEDIIYYAALRKRKILCIVEEGGDNRVSLICPNIPFKKENILFMVHSQGIHYNTFQYPIRVSEEMVYALKHLPVETVSTEYIITIKDFTLDNLLEYIVASRVKRRRTESILNKTNRIKKSKVNTLRSRKNKNSTKTMNPFMKTRTRKTLL
jgi:hypothetical protein